jgi:hypothetical protein
MISAIFSFEKVLGAPAYDLPRIDARLGRVDRLDEQWTPNTTGVRENGEVGQPRIKAPCHENAMTKAVHGLPSWLPNCRVFPASQCDNMGPFSIPAALKCGAKYGWSGTGGTDVSAYFFGAHASSNFVRTPAHAIATLLLGSVSPAIVANPAFPTSLRGTRARSLQTLATLHGQPFHKLLNAHRAYAATSATSTRYKAIFSRTNGKAEHFIQAALREWAYARAYQNSQQRSAELIHGLHRYNWHRPHASLKARTPISRLGLSKDNLLSSQLASRSCRGRGQYPLSTVQAERRLVTNVCWPSVAATAAAVQLGNATS